MMNQNTAVSVMMTKKRSIFTTLKYTNSSDEKSSKLFCKTGITQINRTRNFRVVYISVSFGRAFFSDSFNSNHLAVIIAYK